MTIPSVAPNTGGGWGLKISSGLDVEGVNRSKPVPHTPVSDHGLDACSTTTRDRLYWKSYVSDLLRK